MTAPTVPGANKRVSDERLAQLCMPAAPAPWRWLGVRTRDDKHRVLDVLDAKGNGIAYVFYDDSRPEMDVICRRSQQLIAEAPDLAADLADARQALSAANTRIRELEARRGGSAEAALRSIVHKLSSINDRVEDEGDRVYLGSTNDRERLQECADAVWLWWLANLTGEATAPAPTRAEQDGEGR